MVLTLSLKSFLIFDSIVTDELKNALEKLTLRVTQLEKGNKKTIIIVGLFCSLKLD